MHCPREWGCGPICAEIKVMHCLMDHLPCTVGRLFVYPIPHSPCTVGGLPVVPEHAKGPVLVHVAHLSLQQQVHVIQRIEQSLVCQLVRLLNREK